MKKLRILISALLIGGLLVRPALAASSFPDVPKNAAYAQAAEYVKAAGLMIGDDRGKFNPDDPITRAQMATLVCKMIGSTDNLAVSNQFPDVPKNHPANAYIAKAAELGIVGGYPDGSFQPNVTVTYEQAITMVVRALGGSGLAEKAGGYPQGYVSVANSRGILKNVASKPGKPMPRKDIAVILYNNAGSSELLENFAKWKNQWQGKSWTGQYQCFGFARATFANLFGREAPINTKEGVLYEQRADISPYSEYIETVGILKPNTYGADELKALLIYAKPGDIIQTSHYSYNYKGNISHTMIVSYVSDQKIYICDANNDTKNGIRIDKSFTWDELSKEWNLGLSLYSYIDHPDNTAALKKCAQHSYNNVGICDICYTQLDHDNQYNTSAAGTYEVTADKAYVRTGPYKAISSVEVLNKGDKIEVVASVVNSYGNLWYKISSGNYVYSEGLSKGKTPPTTIAAPAGVSGKWTSYGSNATAELTWSTVNGADYYEVGYKKDNGSWQAIPLCISNTATSYTFKNLDSGSSYSLRVKAVKSNVSSAWSECALTAAKLSAPTNVSGTWTSTGPQWQARISWNAVSGATYYEVQYKTPKTGNAWRADPDYSSGTSYISTGLADYDSYDYRVRACDPSGFSDWANYTLVKPAAVSAPTGISGTWTSTGPQWQARISWNAVSGATRYEVQYRTPKTGNAWRADPDYSSGTSYISTGLADYDSYDYRVRACNSTGSSEWTTYTLVKPAAVSAPTGISGTWTSTGPQWQARISWNAVSGATRYEVQYRTPKTGNAWRADPDYSSGTSYISTGLADYNSYDYRVRACNSTNSSDWTTYTLVKPTTAPVSPPQTPTSGIGIGSGSAYIQQQDGDGCYIAAAAMLISNYRTATGQSAVSYGDVKTANGGGTLFSWSTVGKYGLKDVDLFVTATSNISADAKIQKAVSALKSNPYGVFLGLNYNGSTHAVVITDYANGDLIVNDPARTAGGGAGVKLKDSWIARTYGLTTQEQVLQYAKFMTVFEP